MNAPEKIYGWLDTQLSVARHYGGCKFRGHSYTIDMADPERPLVRQDVLKQEAKDRKTAKTPAEKYKEKAAQSVLSLF